LQQSGKIQKKSKITLFGDTTIFQIFYFSGPRINKCRLAQGTKIKRHLFTGAINAILKMVTGDISLKKKWPQIIPRSVSRILFPQVLVVSAVCSQNVKSNYRNLIFHCLSEHGSIAAICL